jgi:hypothetical protein
MFFTFQISAVEPDAPAAGSAPAFLVNVDKCDGHIWSAEELGEYFGLIGPR